jgi:hypothetical protein
VLPRTISSTVTLLLPSQSPVQVPLPKVAVGVGSPIVFVGVAVSVGDGVSVGGASVGVGVDRLTTLMASVVMAELSPVCSSLKFTLLPAPNSV